MKRDRRFLRRQGALIAGILFFALACAALLAAHRRLLAEIPQGRVEVRCTEGAAPLQEALQALGGDAASPDKAAAPAGMALSLAGPAWEGEVLVLRTPDRFTARWAAAGLVGAGLPAESLQLRDYSWADAVVRQSLRLWRLAAAGLYPLVYLWLARRALQRLAAQARRALQRQYPGDWLYTDGARLLAAAIVLGAGAAAAALSVRWLLQTPLQLPDGWLTRDSLFDADRLCRWRQLHFGGRLTPYGRRLAALLRQSHLLAGLECLSLGVCAILTACLPGRGTRA